MQWAARLLYQALKKSHNGNWWALFYFALTDARSVPSPSSLRERGDQKLTAESCELSTICYSAVRPPSMTNSDPVTNDASSEAR